MPPLKSITSINSVDYWYGLPSKLIQILPSEEYYRKRPCHSLSGAPLTFSVDTHGKEKAGIFCFVADINKMCNASKAAKRLGKELDLNDGTVKDLREKAAKLDQVCSFLYFPSEPY